MDKKQLHLLMDYMIQGKSFRMKPKVREELMKNFYFSDIWFTILSINSSGTVNMCGNFNGIFENYDVDSFVIF